MRGPRTFANFEFCVVAGWCAAMFFEIKIKGEISFLKSPNHLILRRILVPRARLELARQCDPTQDFKSCASTNFATGASLGEGTN